MKDQALIFTDETSYEFFLISEPSALVFNRSIQPEQLIIQRVKELMGRDSENRSLTSSPIGQLEYDEYV